MTCYSGSTQFNDSVRSTEGGWS